MKFLLTGLVISITLLAGCSGKKNGQLTETEQLRKAPSLVDSVDHAIYVYEQRLDIKMKRKRYDIQPGTLVTLQKWFEFGDTTRLVKLRAETLTTDTKLEVTQYHFIDGKLAEIHDYTYNKMCGAQQKQCMDEAKYYFDRDSLKLAQKRYAEGTPEHIPVIESAGFIAFTPSASVTTAQKRELTAINEKYASLPFPKPRPEQGTPVLKK